MKGIKEWAKRISEDKDFSGKYQNINDNKEIARLAREDGFNVTEEDIMDLKMQIAAGGDGVLKSLLNNVVDVGKDALGQAVQTVKDKFMGTPKQAGWYWSDGQGNMTYYGDGSNNNSGSAYNNGGNYGSYGNYNNNGGYGYGYGGYNNGGYGGY